MSLKFIKNFRSSMRKFTNVAEATVHINNLKLSAKNIEIPSISRMFDDAKFRVADNHIVTSNGTKLNSIERLLRRGELRKLGNILGLKTVVRSSDELAFMKTISNNIPDVKVRQLDDMVLSAKRTHPDLDIHTSLNSKSKTKLTGKELHDKLSPKTRTKLEKAFKIIKFGAKSAPYAVGTFGILALSGNLYQNLIDANDASKGCYLLRTINGKTISCKIYNRSCLNQTRDTQNSCTNDQFPTAIPFNVALFLMNSLDNTTKAKEIGIFLNLDEKILNINNINSVLNNMEQVHLIISKFNTEFITIANPCIELSQIEGGIVPACRACNPSANINSTEYVDISDLAENYTLQCIQNVPLIHTLIDVASNLGVKVFDTLNNMFPWVKKFIIIIIAFIILLVTIAITIKIAFLYKNKNQIKYKKIE